VGTPQKGMEIIKIVRLGIQLYFCTSCISCIQYHQCGSGFNLFVPIFMKYPFRLSWSRECWVVRWKVRKILRNQVHRRVASSSIFPCLVSNATRKLEEPLELAEISARSSQITSNISSTKRSVIPLFEMKINQIQIPRHSQESIEQSVLPRLLGNWQPQVCPRYS